jgi:hypothetical protein
VLISLLQAKGCLLQRRSLQINAVLGRYPAVTTTHNSTSKMDWNPEEHACAIQVADADQGGF